MTPDRKPYRREAEDKRRLALVEATLALVAEGGAQNATVRSIAERAGVTAGLIRHYFQSKDQLLIAAYRHLMDRMTDDSASVLRAAPHAPEARLAAFVAASLTAPVVDPEALTLWATFLQETRRDPVMRETHSQTYLGYRDRLQGLIADLPGDWPDLHARRMAIACNAVIDGLWMEGCALPEAFAPGELAELGIRSVGAILGVDLTPWLLLSAPILTEV
ncbi:TetR family transcriptional regulator C-terminal domain-containing protein [Rhodobacter sp. KR11]|jgi:TetR/AcrR family transcriptional repressor of bet genes|uniref:TetR family transcriptional regulator C-terminal domain-containing protein n=1 Tax=Rhodobacter sp. KR11 TaxID=2974588 RepID=UPI00222235E3|nr:TetR family transcriptional regulator C-terminal domain-containing protein [Rhodobacter sp. KR11]MCW1918720.1 TetR family transcriptional regulator C-terminal domain-containing protein [Rhodobacter sp. KR11]